MEDKWQHKLNIAKWKSKNARSELKAVNKQTGKKGTNSHCDSSAIWDSHLPASAAVPKADLYICTAIAYTSLALPRCSFHSRVWASERFTPMVLNFCLLVDLCISSFPLSLALEEHKPKQLSCYSFPQSRTHHFYHGPKSAAPNLTISFLALLANFYHFLSTRDTRAETSWHLCQAEFRAWATTLLFLGIYCKTIININSIQICNIPLRYATITDDCRHGKKPTNQPTNPKADVNAK